MRSLLQFLALCAAAALCVCYDSHESTESDEDLFVPANRANSFIRPQRRNEYNPVRGFNYYDLMRKIKSAAERRSETCEDFRPCRLYSFQVGRQQAYNRYFGAQNQPQRPAGIRRY
ncbi:matrix Gla protein [Anabas testudineus]|uniref:Matrix Gla protein n=1 Tax=Anabas testudineus TaxID=64144 RepID=A0A7N6F9R6_ANATE|nr:matrix Gla protein [Anabas testudineus]XP_026213612.1 matrix Gla protein [Anabas testudineus]